jgi:hypothetical protein
MLKYLLILFLLVLNSFSKDIYISFENIPKNIYKYQIFEVEVKSIVLKDKFKDINTIFTNSENIEVLNPNSKWEYRDSDDSFFYNKFYFKALANEIKLPDIIATFIIDKDNTIDELLDGPKLKAQDIQGGKNFSNIVADEMKLIHYKVSQYDNKSNLVVMEIETQIANLSDFHINNADISKQGIDEIYVNMPFSKVTYYAVVPIHWKKFDFNYFSIKDLKYNKIGFPIEVDTDSVSTQSDLNPKESEFTKYKIYIFLFLGVILLIFAIWKKRWIFVILAIFPIASAVVNLIPFRTAFVYQDAKVRLLPTKNSTIFYITEGNVEVKVIKKQDDYIKVLFDNGKIGWVNEENIIKN